MKHSSDAERARWREIGARIKAERLRQGISQVEAGNWIDLSDGVQFREFENGITKPTLTRLEIIARHLDKPIEFFLSGTGDYPLRPIELLLKDVQERYESLDTVEFPIRGATPAGYPSFQDEHIEGYLRIPKADVEGIAKGAYVLRVIGECLSGDGINSGDLIVVDPSPDIVDGKIYVVVIDDEIVCRHLYIEGDSVKLVATSEHHDTIVPRSELQVLGRVVLSGRWAKH